MHLSFLLFFVFRFQNANMAPPSNMEPPFSTVEQEITPRERPINTHAVDLEAAAAATKTVLR